MTSGFGRSSLHVNGAFITRRVATANAPPENVDDSHITWLRNTWLRNTWLRNTRLRNTWLRSTWHHIVPLLNSRCLIPLQRASVAREERVANSDEALVRPKIEAQTTPQDIERAVLQGRARLMGTEQRCLR